MTRSIGSINARIGDLSFLARYGRAPAATDDSTVRVATHVGFAQRLLRSAGVKHLPTVQRARRAALLDVLADYVDEQRFPAAECTTGFAPAFVDREGCRCAV